MITSDKPSWDCLVFWRSWGSFFQLTRQFLWFLHIGCVPLPVRELFHSYSLWTASLSTGQKPCGKGEHFQASLSIREVDLPNQSIYLYACSLRYGWYFYTRKACFVFGKQFHLWALNYTSKKAVWGHLNPVLLHTVIRYKTPLPPVCSVL